MLDKSKRLYKAFRTNKRFSSFFKAIEEILESDCTDKIVKIRSVVDIAAESLCRICLFDNESERPSFSHGLCKKHYYELSAESRRLYKGKGCKTSGCTKTPTTKGYCRTCYSRIYQSGVDPSDVETLLLPLRAKRKLRKKM